MFKVVLFDLDDTLVSEYDYIKSGYTHISNVLKDKLNDKPKNIFNNLMCLFESDSRNVFNRLYDLYGILYSKIEFFEDVMPMIHKLKQQNIKVGVITDGYKNSQRKKLEALNANKIFDKIIITDELGKEFWKPHPKSFEIMKDYFDTTWEDMVYIGDNPNKDFYVKNYYPIITIHISRKRNSIYENTDYFENVKPDFEIDNLNAINEMIGKRC